MFQRHYLLIFVINVTFLIIGDINANEQHEEPPAKKCTGLHEEYTSCYIGQCVPKTCDDLGKSLPCPRVIPPCKGDCICKEGFVRNSHGHCIDKFKCPSCGGDPNAQSGGSNYCGHRCSDLNKKPTACPLFMVVNGCDCKKGYYFDTNKKRCVLPKHCTPVCSANQTYTQCVNNGADAYCPTCRPAVKSHNPSNSCHPGCQCKPNYKINSDGNCIMVSECPPLKCRGPNEEYNYCPAVPACARETCADRLKPKVSCKFINLNCQPKCVCKNGFWRDYEGKCVTSEQCDNEYQAGSSESSEQDDDDSSN